MTPQQKRAMDRLNEALPREAKIGVSYGEWVHSRMEDGKRSDPPRFREEREWSVTIHYHDGSEGGEYLRANAGGDLEEAVDDALRDFDAWRKSWKRPFPGAAPVPPPDCAAHTDQAGQDRGRRERAWPEE